MDQTERGSGTTSVRGGNLPFALTSFVGRERDLTELARLLAVSRMVTLTGPAGCGKTRLALRLAEQAGGSFPDGVRWVELASVVDASLVTQTVARSLRVPEQPGRSALDRLLEELAGRRLLLVLDNCEHLLRACSELAISLLAKTEISILATSREPLRVSGEMLYPVEPLSLPPETLELDRIDDSEAVQLFVQRARALLPGFTLTRDNAPAVAGICRRLDGIPLAIELASARVNVLTVWEIATRLDDGVELPPAGPYVSYPHHRTLSAAFDWSHDLLEPVEQVMFRRLSVFNGGCSLRAAERVCAWDDLESERIIELLTSLVNKSLVVAETLQRGEARYFLLETIRQYAEDKLRSAGEQSTLRDRHLNFYLELTEETTPRLSGPYQQIWLNWLEDQHDNIRCALAWSLESGSIEKGLRISVALYEYWMIRDYVEEGFEWLSRLLEHADANVSALVHANALTYASFLASFRGKTEAQLEYSREAAVLAESVGDEGKRALFWALTGQAYHARSRADYLTEFNISQRCAQLAREMGDRYLLGLVLTLYSPTAMALGEYDVARDLLAEGLPLVQECGDTYRIAMAHNYVGDLARCERKYAQARIAYEQSVALLREVNAPRDLASVLHNLGHTCLHLGDVERARSLIIESMDQQRSQGNMAGMAECLIGFAALANALDLPGASARLLAAATAHSDHDIATTMWVATKMEYERGLALARSRLTSNEFDAEQELGRSLSLQQAVEYGRALLLSASARAIRSNPDRLTARERQVVALIAEGRSNEEIAGELVVSKRTVEKHIANIRAKLRFSQRAQIVRWAIESELATSDRRA